MGKSANTPTVKNDQEKIPFPGFFMPSKQAAPLGLSYLPTSQTSKANDSECSSANAAYTYRVHENRLTIRPNYVALGSVFTAVKSGVLYRDDEIIPFRITHDKNFRSSKNGRFISDGSAKSIMSSVNWLIHCSRLKRKRNGKNWRLNMVTLTLPAIQAHSEKTLNKYALNHFLTQIRRWGVKNYVWVSECQKSTGNIHWHIMTDVYIDRKKVRSTWNSILAKLGYIDRYQEKMQSLTYGEYVSQFIHYYKIKYGNRALEYCEIAYLRGNSENWRNPNSTDVGAIHSVNHLARYCTKHSIKSYIEQSPDLDGRFPTWLRRLNGRRWGRSESISSVSKIRCFVTGTFSQMLQQLHQVAKFAKTEVKEFERFLLVYFEPTTVPQVMKFLQPYLQYVNYSPG